MFDIMPTSGAGEKGGETMRIASVEAFGVCRTLAEAWERVYGPELLPVQERALRAGVCAGESVVVVAPTGAGKTLVGEMAAAEAALSGRRAVYTVPTRALADEKYEAFSRTYEPLGLRVCVSTRDWRSQDRRIGRGDFDLLVTVNEKLRALLARHREL
jgi:replicative superfamily II helicase